MGTARPLSTFSDAGDCKIRRAQRKPSRIHPGCLVTGICSDCDRRLCRWTAGLTRIPVAPSVMALPGRLVRVPVHRFSVSFFLGSAVKGNLFVDPFPFDGIAPILGAMAFMFMLGPMEEFGWRGVALPLLQRRFAPFWAGLILGLIWSIWHLPAFFLSGTPQSAWGVMPFFVGSVCLSVILTPLFNASGGSILLAGIYHFRFLTSTASAMHATSSLSVVWRSLPSRNTSPTAAACSPQSMIPPHKSSM